MDPSCSTWSLEVGEPLAGTASETELWIVVEHAGPWGPKGADDSGLPAEVVSHLGRFVAQEKRARVQLIRTPEGIVDARGSAREQGTVDARGSGRAQNRVAPRVYLARITPDSSVLLGAALGRIEDVLQIDLAAWAGGAQPPGFRTIDAPLYLVCVHGRRDRCCAQRGMPVYSALSALRPDAVFQTTHLGGHRFAATLLVLPAGICYGRVEASEAEALVRAHDAHRFHDLSRVRGRCAYAPAAQAAEVRLCEELADDALSALRLLGVDEQPDGAAQVRFRHQASGAEHSVRVIKKPLAPSAQSCGATPKASEGLVALTSR